MNLLKYKEYFWVVFLVGILNVHVALCDKVSAHYKKSMTRKVGQDAILMWNVTNGRILEVRWGLLKDGLLNPQLIYMSVGFGPVFSSALNADASRYKGRVSWVGDLSVGHAWFKITNLTLQDTNQYVAAIHELGTTTLLRSSIALTVTGSARFIRTPPRQLRMSSGTTAKLVWDYDVNDRKEEFSDISPIWTFHTSHSTEQRISFEYRYLDRWGWAISSECPARLLNPTRVTKESRATLVIHNVTDADNGEYGCSLELKSGLPIINKVQLVVTGSSIEALIGDSKTEERPEMKEDVPDSPLVLHANTQDQTLTITIHWTIPESHGYPILMYSVFRVELDEAGQEVTSLTYHVNEDQRHYVMYKGGGITGGKTYRFYVTAWNTHGESVKDHSKSITVNVMNP